MCHPRSKRLSTCKVFLLDWLEREMVDMLRRKGKEVLFGIHPVVSIKIFLHNYVSASQEAAVCSQSLSP